MTDGLYISQTAAASLAELSCHMLRSFAATVAFSQIWNVSYKGHIGSHGTGVLAECMDSWDDWND